MPTSKKQLQSRMFKLLEDIKFQKRELKSSNIKLFNKDEFEKCANNITTIEIAEYLNGFEDGIIFLEDMKKLLKLEEQRRKYEDELKRIEKKEKRKEERRQLEQNVDEYLALQRNLQRNNVLFAKLSMQQQ